MNPRKVAACLSVPARWYLGGLFVGACVHKIADPYAFAIDVATYDTLPLALVNLTAIVLPWVELAAGAMLLAGLRTRAAALLVVAMMTAFIAALLIALAKDLDMSCGCFASKGAVDDPISSLTVLRDLAWLGLGVLVLAADRGLLGMEWWLARRRGHA